MKARLQRCLRVEYQGLFFIALFIGSSLVPEPWFSLADRDRVHELCIVGLSAAFVRWTQRVGPHVKVREEPRKDNQ